MTYVILPAKAVTAEPKGLFFGMIFGWSKPWLGFEYRNDEYGFELSLTILKVDFYISW
jgi:hypothetical protein